MLTPHTDPLKPPQKPKRNKPHLKVVHRGGDVVHRGIRQLEHFPQPRPDQGLGPLLQPPPLHRRRCG